MRRFLIFIRKLIKICLFFHNTDGDVMEKRVVYIAYLIIAFVIFDFCYGFSDWVASWQMWNWYLVILLITITSLLIIKYKQNQRKLALEQYAKENDRRRIQLSQLLLFEQLNQLNEELFSELLQRFFELEGYEHIERVNDPAEQGYDLIMWKQGQKIIVKYFRRVPVIENVYTKTESLDLALGELVSLKEIREFYGVMKDYEVQADIAIALTTSDFEEDAMLFGSRNAVTLMNGDAFYEVLDYLKEDQLKMEYEREVFVS